MKLFLVVKKIEILCTCTLQCQSFQEEINEALASVDNIEEKDLDADKSEDYEPEIENLGSPHPLEDEFADALDFAERFQLSDFVVSNMTNLIGKAYGVKGGVISEGFSILIL